MTNVSDQGGSSLRVLVCGGGIAGLAAAFWLDRGGHRVTVVERYPELRAAGAQVDLRSQGIDAVKRMGLLDAVRQVLVPEPGLAFVDRSGRRWGKIRANTSGKGKQTMTSEFEIMRGDLVRILRNAIGDEVEFRYGLSTDDLKQDADKVTVRFSDDTVDEFDLVIGADGQSSRVRQDVLPPGAQEPYRPVGVHMAYWFIPRIAADDDLRDSYLAPGRRSIMRRSHNKSDTQVYFTMWDQSPEASAIHRKPLEEQKQFWANRYRDAGWQTDRFLKGMKSTDFFYSQEVVQVRADRWSSGRVVLLGDAAYCPSPFSGMGTSAALAGAYVLAGVLADNPGDLGSALEQYEMTLRPFVDHVQAQLNPNILRAGFPTGIVGIYAMLTMGAVLSFLHVAEIVARFSKDNSGGEWLLPAYAGLDQLSNKDES